MELVFNKKKHTDFKLKCGDYEFPCHKVNVSARSPVLARALEEDTEADQYEIKTFQPATVKQVLKFIYADRRSRCRSAETGHQPQHQEPNQDLREELGQNCDPS